MNSVTAAGWGLVAVGSEKYGDDVPTGRAHDAVVWISVDGITWSRITHDVTLFGGSGNQLMHSVMAAGAGVVAVGADRGLSTARAGMRWCGPLLMGSLGLVSLTIEAVFGGAEMYSVTVGGGGLVAVGEESLERGGTR